MLRNIACTHRQLIGLTPLTLPLSHNLPTLLDPRQRSPTANVADDSEWCLPTHAKAGTVLGGEHALQVRMHRGVGEIGVGRYPNLVQWQVEHTCHQPTDF